MGLTPRREGAIGARAKHSPAAATFLDRLEPFFAGTEVTAGPLMIATIAALLLTNLSTATLYERFWDTDLSIGFGAREISHTLAEWIDHALLPLFFVVIGADVKRELVRGELSRRETAFFPLAGAVGGLVVPVALFLLIDRTATSVGWGTVVTMDTAFGIGLIALFSTRLPAGVRALMLAFAAIDDVGGLAVIAFAYTPAIDPVGLIVAGTALAAMLLLHRLRWVASIPYVLLALIVWGGVLESGVHATIAGVLVGLAVPVMPRLDHDTFAARVQKRIDEFQEANVEARLAEDDERALAAEHRAADRLGYIQEMTAATDETSERVIVALTPWISYVVLPLFALSNIRIHFAPELFAGLLSPLGLAIIAGLALGKPLGFLSFSWAASAVGLARRPEGVSWLMVGAIGALAGIGFTISLFIAQLAFGRGEEREIASLAILVASLASGAVGWLLLRRIVRSA